MRPGVLTRLRQGYQLLPAPVREAVWLLRAAAKAEDPSDRRRHLLNFRLAVGLQTATVPVGKVRMRLDLRDEAIAAGMYIFREYEPLESSFVCETLRPGDTFVDIGANIGYYSVCGAGIVGAAGRVVAIEPEPRNFEMLRRNVSGNGVLGIVQAVNVALGSETSVGRLYLNPMNFGDHRVYEGASDEGRIAVEIPIERLDDIVRRLEVTRVHLIKMDVQGFEHHALRGMTEVLRTSRPTILMEFWPDGIRSAGGDPEDLLRMLAEAGYAAFRLQSEGLTPLPIEGIMDAVPPLDAKHPDASYLNLVLRAA